MEFKLIPISALNFSDIVYLYRECKKQGILKKIFSNESFSENSFVRTLGGTPESYVVMADSGIAGFFWLAEHSAHTYVLHFGIMKQFWGRKKSIAVSEFALSNLPDHVRNIIGTVRVDNRLTILLVEKLGLQHKCKMENYFYDCDTKQFVDAEIYYMER